MVLRIAFPPLARAFAAVLFAALLANCDGPQAEPAVAVASPSPSPSASSSTGPAGQTNSAAFAATGGTVAVGPYANAAGTSVSLTGVWGASNESSINFEVWLSAGNGDIAPVSTNWIAYNLGGNVVTYLELSALPATVFTQSPQLTFTIGAAVAGTACSIASLSTSGVWQTVLSNGVLSNGKTTVAFAPTTPTIAQGILDVGNVGSANGPSFLALVCQ